MSEERYKFLKRHAKWATDWPIAQLVGSATYAQLQDNAPGLFEPFPDWRSRGNTSSSLKTFFDERHLGILWNRRPGMPCEKYNKIGCVFKSKDIRCKNHCTGGIEILDFAEDRVPGPPNLVSTVILESGLCPLELKCLLIEAVRTGKIDPRIDPLIRSSTSYNNPELTPGQILYQTVAITVLVLFVILFFIKIASE